MEEGYHDIVLIAIIFAIILLQIYVAWRNYLKIQNYKRTVEKNHEFEIIEVSVPEEWIKNIKVDQILKDPVAFQEMVSKYSSKVIEEQSGNEIISQEKFPKEINFPEDENQFNREIEDFEKEDEDEDEEEEYEGRLKYLRKKFKDILE